MQTDQGKAIRLLVQTLFEKAHLFGFEPAVGHAIHLGIQHDDLPMRHQDLLGIANAQIRHHLPHQRTVIMIAG